jgi:DNA polymerase III subunit chi
VTALEQALPRVLEKVLASGKRAVVVAGSAERVEALNAALWTYDDRGFLPHGSAKDGGAADQPIWLTTREENPNGAGMLVLVDGAVAADPGAWPAVCEFFDGRDEAALAAARARWKAAKDAGHALKYFRQTEGGGWEQAC